MIKNPDAKPSKKKVKMMNLYPYKHSAAPIMAKNIKKKYLLLDRKVQIVEIYVGHPNLLSPSKMKCLEFRGSTYILSITKFSGWDQLQ